jgi:hypothetical protein
VVKIRCIDVILLDLKVNNEFNHNNNMSLSTCEEFSETLKKGGVSFFLRETLD